MQQTTLKEDLDCEPQFTRQEEGSLGLTLSYMYRIEPRHLSLVISLNWETVIYTDV